MDYNTVNSLVAKGLSTRKIATELKTSPSNVKYWLKKFNIKTIPRSEISDHKFCPRCEIEKLKTEFYNRRNGKGVSVYCKSCTTEQTIERQKKFKQQCIDYKGGKCVSCGYNKCNNALDFHHLDPSKKEFNIAHVRLTSFNDKVKTELNNCALVCANCHREIHAGLIDLLPYKI
jgi:predicted transcriptional regulator